MFRQHGLIATRTLSRMRRKDAQQVDMGLGRQAAVDVPQASRAYRAPPIPTDKIYARQPYRERWAACRTDLRSVIKKLRFAKMGEPCVPIMGRSPGFVVEAIPTKAVSFNELVRWQIHQPFPPQQLAVFLAAARETTWGAATTVLADDDPEWATTAPASVLAFLGTKTVANDRDAEDAIATLAHRAAVESSVEDISDCLAAIARIAARRSDHAILSEAIAYANRFTAHLARNAVKKEAMAASALQQPLGEAPRLPALPFFERARQLLQAAPKPTRRSPRELTPTLTVLDALVMWRESNRADIIAYLARLLDTLNQLCSDQSSRQPFVPSAQLLLRLTRQDADLVLRASLLAMGSPSPEKLPQMAALCKLMKEYRAHSTTLRVAVKALVAYNETRVRGLIDEVAATLSEAEGILRPTVPLSRALGRLKRSKLASPSASTWLRLIYPDVSEDSERFSRLLHTFQWRWRGRPEAPFSMWRLLRSRGTPLSTSALNAILVASIRAGRPFAAIRLFKEHARSEEVHTSNLAPAPPVQVDKVTADSAMLRYYMTALERARQWNEVWRVYQQLGPRWGVLPNDTHLRCLLRAARSVVTATSDRLEGPVLGRQLRRSANASKNHDEGHWDGRVASERAIATFWLALYSGRPAQAERVVASVRYFGSSWFVGIWAGRSAPQVASRAYRPDSPASSILPSLRYERASSGDGTGRIYVQEPTFKEMIELLGMSGLGHEIPLLLGWMRELDVTPRRNTLAVAYLWFLYAGPKRSDVTSLDRFVTEWLGANRVPTHEEAMALVSARASRGRCNDIQEMPV